MKVTKEISNRLIKYVTNVTFRANPFDKRAKSTEEVLKRLNIARFKKANPKLTFTTDWVHTPDAPYMKFDFADGSNVEFTDDYVVDHHAQEIINEIWEKTTEIGYQFEMEGKNIDDL
mmetsp:Transcript_58159/g.70006  ORF Transcript_58159/g.70006 Transcript_58159/m.70006 type:complete len:117 (+) Transcript_58159:97-447(+)|eukprot:CAMPEP_0171313940 /NCGR_PEP_ID=MMETSP0816-20121228/47280_1 /TAXON_ID=420281 /ORGANISM="Proboscia inermis, Strain CCAP1064/1" /LENGTH=116 /DNA_ID=CAMNT_0011802145 /DNA_START=75 /DNA_END=425 /DNA_ORIENTATION=-